MKSLLFLTTLTVLWLLGLFGLWKLLERWPQFSKWLRWIFCWPLIVVGTVIVCSLPLVTIFMALSRLKNSPLAGIVEMLSTYGPAIATLLFSPVMSTLAVMLIPRKQHLFLAAWAAIVISLTVLTFGLHLGAAEEAKKIPIQDLLQSSAAALAAVFWTAYFWEGLWPAVKQQLRKVLRAAAFTVGVVCALLSIMSLFGVFYLGGASWLLLHGFGFTGMFALSYAIWIPKSWPSLQTSGEPGLRCAGFTDGMGSPAPRRPGLSQA